MPVTRSAKKALRVSQRKRVFNIVRKSRTSTALKNVKKFIAAGKKKEATEALRLAQKALDKAAKTHTLHKNTVSRRKSRLSKMAKKLG